jgi:hypothetical protein
MEQEGSKRCLRILKKGQSSPNRSDFPGFLWGRNLVSWDRVHNILDKGKERMRKSGEAIELSVLWETMTHGLAMGGKGKCAEE